MFIMAPKTNRHQPWEWPSPSAFIALDLPKVVFKKLKHIPKKEWEISW